MILLKLILGIARIVLRILIGVAILACIIPFFIALANNLSLEGGFWNGFTETLGSYHYGELAVSQRTAGIAMMIAGVAGGILFSILGFFFHKLKRVMILTGILSVVGAFITYPTLSGEAVNAFFGGVCSVYNYVVLLTLTLSLTVTFVGVFHFTTGLKACLD